MQCEQGGSYYHERSSGAADTKPQLRDDFDWLFVLVAEKIVLRFRVAGWNSFQNFFYPHTQSLREHFRSVYYSFLERVIVSALRHESKIGYFVPKKLLSTSSNLHAT